MRSRTKLAVVNSSVATIAQMLQLIMQFISRSFFIHFLGLQILGLNGLFINILGYLSFAELGIGSAITFSLYKPLADNDQQQIAAIMRMFRKWYQIIALVVFIGGMGIMPFVPDLINGDPSQLGLNIQFAFFLALLNAVFSYLITYKRTLLIADQRGYLNIVNAVGFNIAGQILQIICLFFFQSFYLFLIIQAVIMLVSNIRISFVVDRLYPYLKTAKRGIVPKNVISYMKKNVSGMFSAKIGGIVVTGTDNLLLSYFVGLRSVALYSNYTMIVMGLTQIMNQLISSVSSSIGNLGVSNESHSKKTDVFYQYFIISSLLSLSIAVGFAGFVSEFVNLWLGPKLVYTAVPLLVISINFLLQNLRQSLINYTNAYGLYWYARWKPVFEAGLNFAVSLILVSQTNLGIVGVLVGTIISNLVVNLLWESYIVLRYAIDESLAAFLKLYIGYIIYGVLMIIFAVWLSGILLKNGLFVVIVMNILLQIGVVLGFLVCTRLLYPKDVKPFDYTIIISRIKNIF